MRGLSNFQLKFNTPKNIIKYSDLLPEISCLYSLTLNKICLMSYVLSFLTNQELMNFKITCFNSILNKHQVEVKF